MAEQASVNGGSNTVVRSQSNGLAIAGLVCGLVGTVLVNWILGPLAIICGGIAGREPTRALRTGAWRSPPSSWA